MLLAGVLICAVGFGLIVYRYDMYEREPWYMLLLAVAMGAGSFWILARGSDFIFLFWPEAATSIFALALMAGVFEELLKLMIVLTIWLAIAQHFNDPFDGLIYGAMAGLGFALAESIFYTDLMGYQASWLAVFGQEAVRLFLHMLMGALTCVGLGLARFRTPNWKLILSGGIAASMFLHFCWDFFCGLPSDHEVSFVQQRGIAIMLMFGLLGLFGASVLIAVKHSGDTHAINRLDDLWGWPFNKFRKQK